MLKQSALLLAAAATITACASPYGAPGPYGGPQQGPYAGNDPYNQGQAGPPQQQGGFPRVGTRTATGAIVGAGAGAILGYLTNTNKSEEGRTNALIGAGIGALAGGAIGNYMDRQQRQLQAQLAGSGVDVVRQGNNIILDMPSDITFAFDRSDLQPQFYSVLDQIASTLSQYPATYVDVVGHADAQGTDEYNLSLSQRRAGSVAGYLVNRGVLGDRLFVAGQGERQPVASNASEAGRAQNRRVEIILRPHTGQG